MNSPSVQAALLQAFLFTLSLLGSYIVFTVLKSTAAIKQKGIQLGGAAAMFVIMFVLLNKYFPETRVGFISEAAAQPISTKSASGVAQIAEVSISPAAQLLSKDELARLDRNEYEIIEDIGVAIPRPKSDLWATVRQTQVNSLGLSDVPALGISLDLFKAFFISSGPTILAIQSKEEHQYTLTEHSFISGVPVTLNFFENQEYVRAAVKAQAGMMQQLGAKPVKELPESVIKEVGGRLASAFDLQIKNKIPIHKKVCNSIYVLSLSKQFLDQNIFTSAVGLTSTLLDKSLLYLSLSGQLANGSLGNMFVDQRRGVASFNGTVVVKDILIDEKPSDAIVNNIGFIVTSKDRVFIVLLVFSSASDIQVFKELEGYLNRFRFAA